VAQARRPWLYARLGVPDTIDGRFDMIVLHAFLIFARLRHEGPKARDLAQLVFDEMFQDMDHSLREMGVGDLSVGKRVRRMAEIFYGRADAYRKALSAPEEERVEALKAALERNVFAGGPGEAWALARYAMAEHEELSLKPLSAIMAGEWAFSNQPEGMSHDA
jgi:cytochrome b pre-mRNA-processing protein 3